MRVETEERALWKRVTDIDRAWLRTKGRCDHCGKSYAEWPCDRSDHFWTGMGLARASLDPESKLYYEPYVSAGCAEPTAQQASQAVPGRYPRHPYAGRRPTWSGYCVNPETCVCECHEHDELPPMEWT